MSFTPPGEKRRVQCASTSNRTAARCACAVTEHDVRGYPVHCNARISAVTLAACLFYFITIIGAAASDTAVLAPASGTIITARMNETTQIGSDGPVVTERIVRREVVGSNGQAWQTHDDIVTNYDSRLETEMPATVSPNNVSTFRYFFMTGNTLEQKRLNSSEKITVSTIIDCDKAIFQSFFPLGRNAKVSVPCSSISIINGLEHPPQKFSINLSYEGRSLLPLPLGQFEVENIRVTNQSNGVTSSEGLMLLDTSTGIVMASETKIASAKMRRVISMQVLNVESRQKGKQ